MGIATNQKSSGSLISDKDKGWTELSWMLKTEKVSQSLQEMGVLEHCVREIPNCVLPLSAPYTMSRCYTLLGAPLYPGRVFYWFLWARVVVRTDPITMASDFRVYNGNQKSKGVFIYQTRQLWSL